MHIARPETFHNQGFHNLYRKQYEQKAVPYIRMQTVSDQIKEFSFFLEMNVKKISEINIVMHQYVGFTSTEKSVGSRLKNLIPRSG